MTDDGDDIIRLPIRVEDVDEEIKKQDVPRGRLTLHAMPLLAQILDFLTGAGTGKYKGVTIEEDESLGLHEIRFTEERGGGASSNNGDGGKP